VIVAAGSTRVEAEIRLHAGGDGDDHGLADGARDAEDVRRGEAGQRRRRDDEERRLQARRAHRVGRFAHVHRHRPHGVLGQRTDVGDDHDAHHQTGREHVEAGQVGVDPLQQGVTKSSAK
jgi:hypothetical protein